MLLDAFPSEACSVNTVFSVIFCPVRFNVLEALGILPGAGSIDCETGLSFKNDQSNVISVTVVPTLLNGLLFVNEPILKVDGTPPPDFG